MRINIDKLRSLGINCGIRRHIESVTERSGYPQRGEMLKKLWELATPYAKRNQLKYKTVILLGAGYAVRGER